MEARWSHTECFSSQCLHRKVAVSLKRNRNLQSFARPIIFQTVYCWCVENDVSGTWVVRAMDPAALILRFLGNVDLLDETPGLALFLRAARLWTWETGLHTAAASGWYHKRSQRMMCTWPSYLLWRSSAGFILKINVIHDTTSRLKINKKQSPVELLSPHPLG